MNLEEYLKNEYGYNTPIFLSRLNIKDITYVNLRQMLSRMVKEGKIDKYAQGIYYFPTETRIGKSTLSNLDIIIDKYIKDNDYVSGYYTGLDFLNKLGISNQVPNTSEIVTNKESSAKRNVKIGKKNIIIRRPYTRITNQNWKELQLIDFFNDYAIEYINNNKGLVVKYIKQNEFSYDSIIKLLKYYPAKASKKIIESGCIDEFTRR